ncbi:nuclear transport factor 2 family protein [Algiphilus sp.]|uniref:nuclear transport factor 2 family protein n=1 Tax=Algiphilus sp. TaxID=1872431 RepID=UPI003B516815
MDADSKRALILRYLDAYNRFDVEAMMATVHDDVVFQNITAGEVTAQADGAASLRQMAEQAKTIFAARRQTLLAFSETSKEAAIQVAFEGVLACDLPNGMKAGQELRLEGRSEFTFEDGRLIRIVDIS